jgi:hypothetical protein
MSKKTSISVDNVNIYDIPGVHVVSFDTNIGGRCDHRVIVKTTKKFKQSLKAKIMEYCKNRQK